MIISRYISREVLSTVLAITSVLILALLCQQTVRYLNYIAVGKIPTNVWLKLVMFEVPYLLALLLPLGLFLGIILVYSKLYANNEMSIMQMYGYSYRKIFKLTLIIAMFASAFVLMLMLWINPWISSQRQKLMASDEATLHLVQTLMPGRFQVSPDGHHVMYVEKLSRNRKRAEGIFLAQQTSTKQEEPSWRLVLANDGYQINDKTLNEPFFVTTGGYRYEGKPGSNDYKIIKFDKYAVRIPTPEFTHTHKENESLSTLELWKDYSNLKRAAEFQWRFSIAISVLVLTFVAMFFSTIKVKQLKYITVISAVLIYIVYINLLFISRHWVEQAVLPTFIGMWWVHLSILLLLGIAISVKSFTHKFS